MDTKQKQISIIIVEDFKLTRVGLRCALNANPDLEVIAECEDAVEGIKQIQNLKPDVVLMDLGLPMMNGIEAMVKIREFSSDVKIIALTSHDREEEVVAALSSGANAYSAGLIQWFLILLSKQYQKQKAQTSSPAKFLINQGFL